MKVFHYVFFVLFLLSAALQLNDPDPWAWVIFYAFAAWLSLMAGKKNFYPSLHLAQVVIALLWGSYILFFRDGVQEWYAEHSSAELVHKMQADKPWIEETRELGGLLIVAFVGGVQWWKSR
jgi:hypothetical protein